MLIHISLLITEYYSHDFDCPDDSDDYSSNRMEKKAYIEPVGAEATLPPGLTFLAKWILQFEKHKPKGALLTGHVAMLASCHSFFSSSFPAKPASARERGLAFLRRSSWSRGCTEHE